MTNYALVLRTLPGCPAWEVQFHQPSDTMAKRYAEAILSQWTNVPTAATGAQLWRVLEPEGPIASYSIRQTVTVEHHISV